VSVKHAVIYIYLWMCLYNGNGSCIQCTAVCSHLIKMALRCM